MNNEDIKKMGMSPELFTIPNPYAEINFYGIVTISKHTKAMNSGDSDLPVFGISVFKQKVFSKLIGDGVTSSNMLIMGRKTYELMGKQLPMSMPKIVLSKDENYVVNTSNTIALDGLHDVKEYCKLYANKINNFFIIGGSDTFDLFRNDITKIFVIEYNAFERGNKTFNINYNSDYKPTELRLNLGKFKGVSIYLREFNRISAKGGQIEREETEMFTDIEKRKYAKMVESNMIAKDNLEKLRSDKTARPDTYGQFQQNF